MLWSIEERPFTSFSYWLEKNLPFETSVLESSTFVASSCSEKNCVSRQFSVSNLVLEKLNVVINIDLVEMLDGFTKF